METISLYKTTFETLSNGLFEKKEFGEVGANLFPGEEIEYAGQFCLPCWKKGKEQQVENGQKCPIHS